MKYPSLKKKATIGVTAPSNGLDEAFHPWLNAAKVRLEREGFKVVIGETAWTQEKARSAPTQKRASELQAMMTDPNIDLIVPPVGGELAIEILEQLDFTKFTPKWLLGYSDLSTLLLAVTLKTGIATAHGPNLIDLRGETSDETTAMWQTVLATKNGESIVQYASKNYQKIRQYENPPPWLFNLTHPTKWQTISAKPVKFEGRLLGGCIDVIRHLVGTPFGDVATFYDQFAKAEPIIWYFENYDLNNAELKRSLTQMRYAGWFDHCAGILFGRGANIAIYEYQATDVYRELADELSVPVVYDMDCGHLPPQLTLINGAFGRIVVNDDEQSLTQYLF
ncbi:MAG: LD-carboxypeptidase [Turicibacter sp.]|nr:LD-carboxypeptidase [Turicibacter sp.]